MKKKILNWLSGRAARHAEQQLRKNTKLWSDLQDYIAKTKSAGCSYADYWALYCYIRENRPIEILECGTGISTIVIARALIENESESGQKGRVTSMEESEHWHGIATGLLPSQFHGVVEIVHSPKVEGHYSLFHGVHYEAVPERPYDFVFVDGPSTRTPAGDIVCNLDFLHIVQKSKKPVSALVQSRLINVYVYQKIFGLDKVQFDRVNRIAVVGPCIGADLQSISGASSKAFSDSVSLWGNGALDLRMEDGKYCAEEREKRFKRKELPYRKTAS